MCPYDGYLMVQGARFRLFGFPITIRPGFILIIGLIAFLYGGELGPDLAEVAGFAGTTEQQVIDLHVGRSYRVYMLGFVPGFAYMCSVDSRIAMSRRPTPRVRVPLGSVGIGGITQPDRVRLRAWA